MVYIIITFIIYILIMAIINYYRSEVICYLGITMCPVCNKFTEYYLKENGNHNVTFMECNNCHRKLQIAEELSIYDRAMYIMKSKRIPPPEDNRLLFKDIMEKTDTIIQDFITNIQRSGKEEAIQILRYDIDAYKSTLTDYAEENNYSKQYVIDFFDRVYLYKANKYK